MEFVPVKIIVSEMEMSSTKGTLREMLIDRGYTPIAAQLPGANRLISERKIYALDEVRARAPRPAASPPPPPATAVRTRARLTSQLPRARLRSAQQPRRDAFETSARLNLTDTRSRPRPVVDESEDLRARVAAKAEHIARETRAIFQQRLEK